ncbi:hypothetical protein SISNIDRAFT_458739, partial [Sistotremastrum niveocremeum HHB9708]
IARLRPDFMDGPHISEGEWGLGLMEGKGQGQYNQETSARRTRCRSGRWSRHCNVQ